jgi:hypothetical protein
MKNALYEKIEVLKEARHTGILLGKATIENSKIIARLQKEVDELKSLELKNAN